MKNCYRLLSFLSLLTSVGFCLALTSLTPSESSASRFVPDSSGTQPSISHKNANEPLTVSLHFNADLNTGGYSWDFKIKPDRKATISLIGTDITAHFRVSARQFRELRRALTTERFFELQPDYGDAIPGSTFISISISQGTKARTVQEHNLWNWKRIGNKRLAEARRAERIWDIVKSWMLDPNLGDELQHPLEHRAIPDTPSDEITEISMLNMPGLSTGRPFYKVMLYSDGQAAYEGIYGVPRVGKFNGRIGSVDFARLVAALRAMRYLHLRRYYGPGVTDLQSYSFTIGHGNKRKLIEDYGPGHPVDLPSWRAPESIRKFERLIDDTIKRIHWVKVSPANKS